MQVLYPLDGGNFCANFLAIRLKNMHSQVSDLAQQINELKGKASMYKQRFEKKSSDLQKAEAEVSLDSSFASKASFILTKHTTLVFSRDNCVHINS